MTVVAATVADENGCSIGVRHLLTTTLPELGMSPRFVILGEPTGLTIGTGHGGWAAVDVSIRSRVEDAARRAGNDVVETLRSFCEGDGVEPLLAIMTVADPREDRSGRGFLAAVRVCLRLFPGEAVRDGVDWLEGSVVRIVEKTREAAATVCVHEEDQLLYTGHTKRVRFSVPPWMA